MNSLAKKALIFALALVAVAAAGRFGRKAYRTATERRLIAQAHRYFLDKDLHNATICLRRALQVDPWSVEAAWTTADMLEAAGMPAALNWRIRAAQLKPTEMEYRFAWARTALKIQNLRSAAEALSGVDDPGKATATYHKLGGALAWELHNAAEAEKQYTEALQLEPTNASIPLNLATIHLASTNIDVANAARLSMERMAAATNSELRTTALHYLAADANSHKLFGKAIGYSSQLLQEPSATFADRIVHLQLLREAKSAESAAWLASLQNEAKSSPALAFLLGKWMAEAGNPATALAWLQSLAPSIQTNQPVPLIVTDCQVALKDWSGLLALINRQDWGELNYYRLALESLAQHSLGQNTAATAAWQKALRQSALRLDSLSRLAQVTASWRWAPEHTEVLEKITTAFPKEKWAVDQLVAQLYAQGDTRGIQTLLTKVQASNPTDARLKNNLANVFLLRNSEVEKANRLAKEAYDAAPNNPFFASTYAYSLFLQNRRDEAVKVFAHVKTEYLQIPSVAAYYGVVEAQCGHNDIAKDPLTRADAGTLLPEEKELVRRAKARL
jgi:Flp pilus assembly protein TadD